MDRTESSPQGILLNGCYGGFRLSRKFTLHVFTKYPPHTPEGAELFEPHDVQEGLKYDVTKGKPLIDGYVVYPDDDFDYDYIVQQKTGIVYCPSCGRHDSWRSNQLIVKCALEYGLEEASERLSALYVAYVPAGYEYRYREYDGMESITIVVPYDKICRDLLTHIKEGSSNFKSTFTRKLLAGELQIEDLETGSKG
jgi:hypothetical protein